MEPTMSDLVEIAAAAVEAASGASSATLTTALDATQQPGRAMYLLRANQDIWWGQGPIATTFTYSGANNAFTATGHGMRTGMAVQVSTTVTLPTGLSAATTYWVIVVDVNTFKLASSYANAIAGTAVTISGAGSGVQTFDTVATAGSGSSFLPAKSTAIVDGAFGPKVAIVQDSVGGKVAITPAAPVR